MVRYTVILGGVKNHRETGTDMLYPVLSILVLVVQPLRAGYPPMSHHEKW
jgi:hypothetical protein